ncbi:MAG: hypothetical protein WCY93_10480 [Anaerolineaceae bacterium]
MTATYYEIRVENDSNSDNYIRVPAEELPQVVDNLDPGSYQYRALGVTEWSEGIAVEADTEPREIEYFGGQITYTVVGGTDGQYEDGSWWTTGQVVDTSPSFIDDATRTLVNNDQHHDTEVHGWMVDPGNAEKWKDGDLSTLALRQAGNYGTGSGNVVHQAYDSLVMTNNLSYNSDNSEPYPITSGSVVKARSRLTDIPDNGRPVLDYKAILTVVDTAPASGSIRPPVCRSDKTPILNISSLNLGVLRNLDATGISIPSYSQSMNWLSGTHTFQVCYNVAMRNILPYNGLDLDPYFGNTAEDWAAVMLAMHTNAYTTQQKENLAIQIGKIACDIAARVYEGGIFQPNGGHCHGRLPILAFAAELFDNSYLRDACGITSEVTIGNVITTGQSVFGDLSQLYYITQEMIDDSEGRAYPFPQDVLGWPAWGSQFGIDPTGTVSGNIMGNANTGTDNTGISNAVGYQAIVGKSLAASSLALRLLQGVTPNIPQLFYDYSDRWIGFEMNDKYVFPDDTIVKPSSNLTYSWVKDAYAEWSPLVSVWAGGQNNTINFALLGQSELEYMLNPSSFYRQVSPPSLLYENLTVLHDGAGANAEESNTQILHITTATAASSNPGTVAIANMLGHIFPDHQFNMIDLSTPGTGLRALLDDSDTSRRWSILDEVVTEARTEFGEIGYVIMNWWNSTSSQLKQFPETFSPGIMGERWNGDPYTLGTAVTDGSGGYTADHCFWDMEADSGELGRGIFIRDATKLSILGPGPYIAAPDDTPAINYSNVTTTITQLDRPARDKLAEFMADERVQTFGRSYGVSTHVCKFGDRYDTGGSTGSTNIHPSTLNPDGQVLFAQHHAVGLAMAMGANIYEPQIIDIEVDKDGLYADVIVDLPNGGTLTTIRILRELPDPDPAPAQWQPVTGFEIGPNSSNLSPHGFTSVIQDSGSGSPRTGRVRITPTTPFEDGDIIEYLRGSASAILLQDDDLIAGLYQDMLIEHVPALAPVEETYPYPGIPVRPQPPALVVELESEPVEFVGRSVNFDRSDSSYMSNVSTEFEGSNEGMFSVWIYFTNSWASPHNSGNVYETRVGTTIVNRLYTSHTGRMTFLHGSPVPNFTTPTNTFLANEWYHVLGSWKTGENGWYQLYVNDEAVAGLPSLVEVENMPSNDTMTRIYVASSGGSTYWDGDMGHLYINYQEAFDLSVTENRRKFIDASGKPVDLGATGNIPTGNAPTFYFDGVGSAWNNVSGGPTLESQGTITEGGTPEITL